MDEIRLPGNIPIFPLEGVLLLPGGLLPLHIFEQRYLHMFRDALQGDGIIGMIQPSTQQTYQSDPPVYMTGCAGKITRHEDTSDGRILISLRGLCRFDIVQENDEGHLYRTAEVSYLPSGNIFNEQENSARRKRLLNAASLYLQLLKENAHLEPILDASMSELVTTLSMHCPFTSSEKQSLLEAVDVESRVDTLIELLEQAALESWTVGEHTAN